MNIKTALVAWNCRLRERAGMIQNCKRHPEDMSVKQWSDAHSITVANYYYRMKEVRKPLLIRSVELLSRVFFVKHFSLKKASEFPVFNEGFSLL